IPERGAAATRRAASRLAFVKDRLADGSNARGLPERLRRFVAQGDPARSTRQSAAPSYPVPDVPGVRSNFTREGYFNAVGRVIEYVYAGDIFQANLSQRLQAPLVGTPLDLYRRLRNRNPAPFSAYLDFGDLVVASSSPERFLRVHPGGAVETRPIKGTRPRGLSPEHDAALARALVESDKDRAENVMIVDLLRNDLSRVCRAGTVRVPELFAVEHYATVHHLVSTVVGELTPEHDPVDLLRAAFPGGSITGAPKVRAMQIFDGTTRAGWDGDTAFWRVEHGAIVGETTSGKPLKANTFIIWRGGRTRDFELTLEYRMSTRNPAGNSGVQFRSALLPDAGR